MLQKISGSIARLIKAQQHIHNTYAIAKELVENALDAASSCIKVIVDDSFVIVEDNGEGIDDMENVCKVGHTSKENSSYRVLGVEYVEPGFTHGFRGMALSSISEQCDVEITSRCGNTDLATSKNYATGKVKRCPRETGTTVKVSNIFRNCPIRRSMNEKNIRRHLTQILSLLKAFTYTYDASFTLVYRGKILFVDKGSSNTREFSIRKHGEPYLDVHSDKLEFYLFPFDRSETRIVLFNRRVCTLNRVSSTIDRMFRMFFDHTPTFVLIVKDDGDVNLSIDKTEVILKDEKYIENKIKSEMDRYFATRRLIEEDTKRKKNCMELASDSSAHKGTSLGRLEILSTALSKSMGIQQLDTSCSIAASHSGHSAEELPVVPISVTPGSAYMLIREEPLHHRDIIIDKTDFTQMQIIGQFNQGFILCLLQKRQRLLLIAVDQHAADEIYNFEGLKSTFVLKKQRLLQPVKLQLDAIQELVLEDNMAAFERNGFVISNGRLMTIPMYQGTLFSVDDFHALLEGIAKGATLSEKFRTIMASKACRKSVMIGTGLSLKEMRTIVDNLAALDLPWNCPHGRPTFKILSEL